MKISEIRRIAEHLGIDPGNMEKPQLIRLIQETEGYPPSFGNNDGNCQYVECAWWDDCIREFRKKS